MIQTIQTKLRIVAMPTEVAEHIRESLRDEFGNVLEPGVEHGSGPCRHCLRYSEPGEPLLLFSYRPFGAPRPYQEVGPVFLHARSCPRHPSQDSMPVDFANRPIVLRPYDKDDDIADSQRYVQAGEAATIARELLANENVAYVHARSQSRGCYLFRIEREALL
jgi:hypothetical protein